MNYEQGRKAMHRFYLPPEQCRGETLFLSESEARHAVQVLRLRRGERVSVLNGAGLEFLCQTRDAHRSKVSLAVLEQQARPPPACQITLLQALPKGQIIESIIRKATELGAARIVPLLAERVVTRPSAREAVHKAEKWQRAAIEAIKQCGLAWLPKVQAPLTLQEWLARQEQFELPFLASLQPGSRHPRQYFEAFGASHGRPPRTACVWVGPEGDFTPAETEAIKAAGSLPITLGPRVLRTETAAIYCLSVLSYELQACLHDAEPAPETTGLKTAGA
jgi:16S rRNA (uracil1498-N3)-methyltransferase